ncbi:unnamed protein product, partial [Litomosoides sigmodontis]
VNSAEYLEDRPVLKIVISASPSRGKYGAQLLKENDNFKLITKDAIREVVCNHICGTLRISLN